MEYVAGETFGDIIASGRPVPLGEKLAWLDQLLAGLHYAHSKGIVHRDLPDLLLDVARKRGPLVVHGDDDAEDLQLGVRALPHLFDRLEQVVGALEREV